MPWDRSLYPDNWDELALEIKNEANWTCQACSRPCRKPGEDLADLAKRLPPVWLPYFQEKPRRFVLTVAHMDHRPENCDRKNLRAWCVPCHARYDLQQMGTKRALKAERAGQLRIEGV